MGVDAELYVWGPFVSDADLQAKQTVFETKFGKPFEGIGNSIGRCAWWEDQHGMDLLEVDLDGARFFDVGWGRFTGWPKAMERIRVVQELFPEHFLIYTNDSYYMDSVEGHEALTEERILEIDTEWWAKADKDLTTWRRERNAKNS